MRFSHPILQEVAALGFPEPSEVVINHGAAMVIRGYRNERPGGDIDLCVSEQNARYVETLPGFVTVNKVVGNASDGSEISVVVRHDPARRFDIHVWDFSPALHEASGQGRLWLSDQIALSDQDDVTGIWVAKKELLLLEKRGSSRPQDISDVALLETSNE